ncbi:MAG: M23 family metallopeptidase, partial [Chloroflexota bacterium]
RIPFERRNGNTATLNGGRVFLGFDTVGAQGYILNSNMSLAIFPTGFVLQDPPASVFEIYPVQVLGVSTASAFDSANIPPSQEAPIAVEPFLYWMLPDFARSVTCYADSSFTDSIYEVECPGLQTPRAYAGHEGTDVGGRPAGLPIGTPVYAASAGMVIKTLSTCAGDDITCGDAYGNYVLLEHTRVRDYNTQTWFTGYAHLQSVLVEENTFVDYIGTPIALSGTSGLGGAHLHFEVRAPHLPISTNWVDPYDTNTFESDTGLWIVADGRPLAAPIAFPPPILLTCQSPTGNNIRSGPGTNYDVVTQTTENTIYEVTQIQTLTTGAVPGDWYQIQWDEGASTGWLWSELMTGCAEVDN